LSYLLVPIGVLRSKSGLAEDFSEDATDLRRSDVGRFGFALVASEGGAPTSSSTLLSDEEEGGREFRRRSWSSSQLQYRSRPKTVFTGVRGVLGSK